MSDQFETGPKWGHFEQTSERPGLTKGEVRSGDKPAHDMYFDESPPLGKHEHPSPVSFMFGSLIACQISVLAQCLKKARIEEYRIEADAQVDERSRGDVEDEMPDSTAKRIDHINIDITLEVPEEHRKRAKRCLDVYDTGCIVGQSFKAGIDYTPNTTLTTADDHR